MKKIGWIVGLMLWSLFAYGQYNRFGAGLTVGGNVSQILGDREAGYNKVGIVAGVRGTVYLTYKTEIVLEMLYDQRGSRNSLSPNNVSDPWKFGLNYVAVPVIFSYKDWFSEEDKYFKLHFSAGLAYGRLINVVNDGAFISDQRVQELRENELSYTAGVTYHWTPNWGFTGRFTRSIFSLAEGGNPAVRGACTGLNNCQIYPYAFNFRLEYRF